MTTSRLSKQHYQLIADIFKEQILELELERYGEMSEYDTQALNLIESLVHKFSAALKSDNERFTIPKFEKACGIETDPTNKEK
jgi:hypothetical protein